MSYPITAHAVVQARAIQHKSASQTNTRCRTSPQTSQEVVLMNTCPHPFSLPPFHTLLMFTLAKKRSDVDFRFEFGCVENGGKAYYDWQRLILKDL